MSVIDPVIAWLTDCGLETVTLGMVMEGANRPRRPVIKVMDILEKNGYVLEVRGDVKKCMLDECGVSIVTPKWKIVKTPALLPSGTLKKATVRDKVWRAVRMSGIFTTTQIQRVSGATYDTVRLYLNKLESDGWVRRTGHDGGKVTWQLLKGHKQVKSPVVKKGKK